MDAVQAFMGVLFHDRCPLANLFDESCEIFVLLLVVLEDGFDARQSCRVIIRESHLTLSAA
jgi:hypothetical protein